MINKKIITIIIAISFAIIVKMFLFDIIKVDGNSMLPNLKNNEIAVIKKTLNTYKRFDIVVIKIDGKTYVKRIVGLPAETIEYINNGLYINGEKITENFDHSTTKDFTTFSDNTIPKNYYFVIGDNRSNSMDSRIFGLINIEDIVGRVVLH